MSKPDTRQNRYDAEIKRYFDLSAPPIDPARLEAEADAAWQTHRLAATLPAPRRTRWWALAAAGALMVLVTLSAVWIESQHTDITDNSTSPSSAAERFWSALEAEEDDDIATMLATWESIVERPSLSKEAWVQTVATDWQIIDSTTLFQENADVL